MTRQLWVFAGPNGAGKSTLVARYVRERIPVVNPDVIARNLPPGLTGRAREVRAGRMALAQRADHLQAGHSFGFETTLTGHTELNLMREAKALGYRVNLVFVGLENAKLSISRVHIRTLHGGHDVPREAVMLRFGRSMNNLAVALRIADRSFVLDNTDKRPRLLLSRENGHIRRVSQDIPQWVTRAIPEELRNVPSPSRPIDHDLAFQRWRGRGPDR